MNFSVGRRNSSIPGCGTLSRQFCSDRLHSLPYHTVVYVVLSYVGDHSESACIDIFDQPRHGLPILGNHIKDISYGYHLPHLLSDRSLNGWRVILTVRGV